MVDLHGLSPDAAALRLYQEWPGPRTCTRQPGCPVIEVKPWGELLMSVSTRLRKNARRSLRRAEEDGVDCVLVGPGEADQAAHRLIALQREMWWGRDIDREHLTRRFESHLVAAAGRMTACGSAGIYEFRKDGDVFASHFLLLGRDFVADYLVGAKHEALVRYQMHSLYAWNSVMVARSRGIARIDLLQGEEPYKLRWASDVIPTKRVILTRGLNFARPRGSIARRPTGLPRRRRLGQKIKAT